MAKKPALDLMRVEYILCAKFHKYPYQTHKNMAFQTSQFLQIYRAYKIKTEFSLIPREANFWWRVHKAFWHLNNPDTQFMLFATDFPGS